MDSIRVMFICVKIQNSFIYKVYWHFIKYVWMWIRATGYHQMQWCKHQEHDEKNNQVHFYRYHQIEQTTGAYTEKIHYPVHNKRMYCFLFFKTGNNKTYIGKKKLAHFYFVPIIS